MNTEIRLPKMGSTMEEASIASWEKQIGEYVHIKDIIATIETDKAILDIEASEQGFLIEQRIKVGDSAAVGSIIGLLSDQQQSESDFKQGERIRISPAARRLAGEKNVSLEAVVGTGPGGRIVLRDVISAGITSNAVASKPKQEEPAKTASCNPVNATSSTNTSSGSNTSGTNTNSASNTSTKKLLSAMRKTISDRLTYSFREIPQFQIKSSVNLFHILNIREVLVNSIGNSSGARLSVLDFIIQAVGMALRQAPQINVSFVTDASGSYIMEHQEIHIGLAVSVQGGLVVPVIRNADQLSLLEIAQVRHDLVSKAKAGTLSAKEMTGSTFTISSLASFEIAEFTAIVNPPEAGILAVSKAQKLPIAVGDSIEVATIMQLNASFDHRPLDGADGAQFMQLLSKQLASDRWKIV